MPPDSEPLVLSPVNYAPSDQEKAKRHKLLWKYNTKKSISGIGISALGNRLVMGCEDHYIYYFDKEKELIWDYNCLSPVKCVAMTESGNSIAVGTEKHVLLLNSKGERLWDYKVGYPVRHIILTNSGDLIIAGGDAHKVFFFDRTGKLLKQHRTVAGVSNLCKTDDDNLFIATSEATIMLFTREPNLIWNFKTQWNIQTVTISGRGEIIVVGAMTSLYCINNRRDLLWKHTGKNVTDVVEVSRSKDYIIIGARDGILSSYTVMGDLNWQYRTGSVKATAQKVMTKGVTATKVTQNGQYIAVGSVNKNVYFLSRNQELLYKFEAANEIVDIQMSRTGTSMAVIAGSTVYFLENIGLYPMLFDEIASQLQEAHQYKINVSKPLGVYEAAVESYNKGNYEVASSTLSSVNKQIMAQQKLAVTDLLSKITINMAKAEVAEKDLSATKGRLAQAKETYKKGNFYEAVSTFHEIIANLRGMTKESVPPPEPESEEAVLEVVATPMESTVPWAVEKVVPIPPKDITPKPVEPAIQKTRETVTPTPKKSDSAKKAMKREAITGLDALMRRIRSVGGVGFDITLVEEIARNSKRALERGDFKKAIELTAQGQMEADELHMRGEKKKSLDLLSGVTSKLSKAKLRNINTLEYEMTLAKGVKAFDKDLFQESMNIVRKLDTDLDRVILKASPRYENVQNLIKKVAGEVKELKNAGMNTLELEDMVEDCWNFLNSDISYSESMVKEANERIIELKEQHDKIKGNFKDAQERIEVLEQKGYNTTRVQGIYQDALIVLYSGNLKMAIEYLDQLITELDDLKGGAGSDEGFPPSSQDDLLVSTLKEKIAHLQDEVILKNEEVSKKEHQISELYIIIRELEEKLKEVEKVNVDMKECPECDYSVPTDNRFCGGCGHKFQMVCPNCGTSIPEGFAFCGKCGTKIE